MHLRVFAFLIVASLGTRDDSEDGDTMRDQARTFMAAPGVSLLDRFTLIARLEEPQQPSSSSMIETQTGMDVDGTSEIVPPWRNSQFSRFQTGHRHMGSGSFGDVWSALNVETGETVAIKFFMNACSKDPRRVRTTYISYYSSHRISREERDCEVQSLDRAMEECAFMKTVFERADLDPIGASHINGCLEDNIKGAGPGRGEYARPSFLVLRLAGKTDAFNYLVEEDETKTVKIDEVRSIIAQVLQGIRFLQGLDSPIIHHDIKTENVAISGGGSSGPIKAQLIDFGLAKDVSKMTVGLSGTAEYIPPEAFSGPDVVKPYHAFDVYSTGVMYFYLLCPTSSTDDPFNGGPRAYPRLKNIQKGQELRELIRFSDEVGCQIDFGPFTEDLKLIAQMIARSPSDRPSPQTLLDSDILSKVTVEMAVQPTTDSNVGEADDANRLTHDGETFKCCCNRRSGEDCKLTALTNTCKGKWFSWNKQSCSCYHDGLGWYSAAGQCPIPAEWRLPDLNAASKDDLTAVIGIDEVLAGRIIDQRPASGYSSWDQVKDLPHIGEKRLAHLKKSFHLKST